MDGFKIFGRTIMALNNEQTIDQLNKLEAHVVGKPCKNLDGLINELYMYWLSQAEDHFEDGFQLQSRDGSTKSLEESILQLKNQIEQLNNEVFAKESEIQSLIEENSSLIKENQSLNKTIVSLTEDNDGFRKEVEGMNQLMTSLTENIISLAEYVEVTELKQQPVDLVLENLGLQIDKTLQIVGIVPVMETGIAFDNRFQRVVTIRVTDDITKNNIVAETLGKGYRRDEQCIKEQEVIVYRCKNN